MGNLVKGKNIQETGTSTVTIAAPGAGKHNCLTNLTVESDGNCTVTIQSPAATTLWQAGINAGGGIIADWSEENPFMGAQNQAVVVAVSGGNYTINVRGFITL